MKLSTLPILVFKMFEIGTGDLYILDILKHFSRVTNYFTDSPFVM